MPKLLELPARKPPIIAEDVRASAQKVLEGDWPFIMLAKNPDGEWVVSLHQPVRIASDYELAGVLLSAATKAASGDLADD